MPAAPQELLKEYVQSQHFTSTAEIMTAMKEMFRDVVQTVMEVEMDEELGRERELRAENYWKIQPERRRDGGEDSGAIFLRDEPMDAIHYKVREDHRYVTKAAYVVLGIAMDGRKDILGGVDRRAREQQILAECVE